MNEVLAQLASQNFYSTPSDLRSFFSLAMSDSALKAFNNGEYEKKSISTYGEETVTIRIEGMMLRTRSWLTDLGFAVSTEEVIDEIKQALSEEKKVKLLMNTGGGLVSGTSNLADLIYRHRDKIEAYATGVVASAGIWVYSASGKRYAEDTTVMGSIGVVTSVLDDEEYWKNYGVVWKEIVSENAKNKRPDVKTDSGQAEVRRYLTALETVFLNHISRNFNMSKEDIISKFHEGGLITGNDALELGVIEALTSYDGASATMPSLSAEKIANNSNIGEGVMDITQEKLDALQASLDKADASITAISAERDTLATQRDELTAQVEQLTSDLNASNAKLANLDELVGMAFEHGVDKETAIAMVKSGDKAQSALILVQKKGTVSATTVAGDNTDVEPQGTDGADAISEDEEIALAIEIAKKISVNKK